MYALVSLFLKRNDPPGKTTISAEQELLRLSEANPEGLGTMDPIKDFNIRDFDMVTTIARKQSLEEQIGIYTCLNCPKFTEHVSLDLVMLYWFGIHSIEKRSEKRFNFQLGSKIQNYGGIFLHINYLIPNHRFKPLRILASCFYILIDLKTASREEKKGKQFKWRNIIVEGELFKSRSLRKSGNVYKSFCRPCSNPIDIWVPK